MLTEERHSIIMNLLEAKGIIRIQELVETMNISESTVRRDLSYLEKRQKLKRIHGGASLLKRKKEELSFSEKSTRNLEEKIKIASYAASLVQDGDCLFLDGGTTTYHMIEHINAKDITVVTNGVLHLNLLLEKGISTFIVGGYIKPTTKAVVGQGAVDFLKKYRFDKTFLGINGIHIDYGYTTPDPEEAAIKSLALFLCKDAYVLADDTKFNEVTFSQIANVEDATIITNLNDQDILDEFLAKTKVEVAVK